MRRFLGKKVANRNNTADAISQYDVLLVERENELMMIPYNHVGNNRLNIFVKMHLQEFLEASDSDAQYQVVRTLMDTVQQQCIDSACQRAGKFLKCAAGTFGVEKLVDTNAWAEPSTDAIGQFVKSLLEQEQDQQAKIAVETVAPPANMDEEEEVKKRRRRSSLLRRSLSSGNMLEDQKKRIFHRKSILMQLDQFDVSEGDSSDEQDDQLEDDASKEATKKPITQQEEKKLPETPERQKTEPESALSSITSSNASKKLPSRRLERRSSFGSVARDSSKKQYVHTANALDVLIDRVDGEYELQQNHTGNNRLAVMMDLRKDKYNKVKDNKMDLHRLCLDLVHTVNQHYNGRFLVEQKDGQFALLSNEQSAFAIGSIFKSNSAADVTNAMHNSYSSMSTMATAESHDGSFASLPSNLQVSSDVHKAAIASLQRRKKRQDTNTKISQMVNRSQLMVQNRAASVGTLAEAGQRLPSTLPVQRRASVGMLQDRRPTLSNFSQEIIRDMLLQLDESNQLQSQPLGNDLDDLF